MLRRGSAGPEVERWQTFLLGLGLYKGVVDGVFGPETETATRALQRRANREGHALTVDGIAGNETIDYAMTLGFVVDEDPDDTDPNGSNWPPPAPDLEPLTDAQRERAFGHIEWEPAPPREIPKPSGSRTAGPGAIVTVRSIAAPSPTGGVCPAGYVLTIQNGQQICTEIIR